MFYEQYRQLLTELQTRDDSNRELALEAGLREEMGEVWGVLKRQFRDDPNYDVPKNLCKELGDLLAYVTLYIDEMGYPYNEYLFYDMLKSAQADLLEGLDDFNQVYLWRALGTLSMLAWMLGVSFEEVAIGNIDKLTLRANKGLAKGSGSNREVE
jgi:NTP pyrophosphatase (non-canonical NTP hydrolase)